MEITVSKDSSVPLHTQLLNEVRHYILSGQWPPGSRIPSELQLQQQLQISRSTIRQALRAAQEGLIERVPGKGTFVARSLADKSNSQLIGFVISEFRTTFEGQLLCGAENVTRARGYRIIFYRSKAEVSEENRLLELLMQDRVGGIIIWPALGGDEQSRVLFRLAAQGTPPLALMDRTFPNLECDCVLCDNYGGAYAATEHLIALGHRQIVFLSRPILQLLPIAERLRGYRQALLDAGLSPLPPLLVGIPDHEITAEYALRTYTDVNNQDVREIARYLESPQRATAIFTMNDLMALQVLSAARLVGLRVPDDFSLVGFDDLDIVTQLEVPLTTVAQDPLALGSRAAEMIIERIEGYNGPARQVVLPTQLMIRASTAPPSHS
ncbi:MAG: GntR family transcriptional regulator [Anaerolineae bacterium]|nr:GntR family transcriptional regulator [Anaerolineae bacterium]